MVGRRRLLPRGPQTPPVGRVACLAISLFCTLSAVGAEKKSDLAHGAIVDMCVTKNAGMLPSTLDKRRVHVPSERGVILRLFIWA